MKNIHYLNDVDWSQLPNTTVDEQKSLLMQYASMGDFTGYWAILNRYFPNITLGGKPIDYPKDGKGVAEVARVSRALFSIWHALSFETVYDVPVDENM